jgi:hypothetical protein
MMLDADIVAVSPSSVWRVLGQAGLLSRWNGKPSKKGTGFEQPLAAHQRGSRAALPVLIAATRLPCTSVCACVRSTVRRDVW